MAYMMDEVDQKSVKKGKFGPLDVYPQEEKQREDELSTDFVKSGFKYVIPELLKEYEFHGICKDSQLSSNPNSDNDIVRLLMSVVNKREENALNTQIELNKKQQAPQKSQQTFRPNQLILITNNQKTKEAAYTWFKQLASNESLMKLSKKIPVFNKRAENLPEILITLYEYQVPLSRAVWYLKIINLTNLNEVKKIKRQQTIDVSSEWTLPLVKFMREIFYRLQYIEQYNYQQAQKSGNDPTGSFTPAANTNNNPLSTSNFSLENFMNVETLSLILLPVVTHSYLTEQKLVCLWHFTSKLMRAMLDQNLLDKQLILESMLDILEKNANGFSSTNISSQASLHQRSSSQLNNQSTGTAKNTLAFFESTTIKLLLTTITHNMHLFLQSELLSRRLAYFCCRRLSYMFNEFSAGFYDSAIKQLKVSTSAQKLNSSSAKQGLNLDQTGPPPTPAGSTSSTNQIVNYVLKKNVSLSSVKEMFDKFVKCGVHRNQIILLTSIVHAIELGCMQALIWNDVGDGVTETPYNGSPLDFMPCPPSRLLYTYNTIGISNDTRHFVRAELEKAELCIKRRSITIENNWCIDKLKQPTIGQNHLKILEILDVLDKHCYDLADVGETLDKLYKKIFPAITIFMNRTQMKEATDLIGDNSKASEKLEAGKNGKKPDEDILENEKNPLSDNMKALSDKEIIFLLCDWAVTTNRCGLHRIFYVVFLLRKRHIDWVGQFKNAIRNRSQSACRNCSSSDGELLKAKKQPAEDSDLNDEITSRKRKFKLNESDENEEKSINEQQPASSSTKTATINDTTTDLPTNSVTKDDGIKKKMRLENNESLDTSSNIKSEPILTKCPRIEQKRKSLSALKPLNMRERLRKRVEKQRLRRLRLLRLKQQKKRLKQKEEDERIESGLYEFLFQSILLEYLETKAPCLDEESIYSRLSFTSLTSLFHMFINTKLFSHDRFVCTLISRGESFKNNLNDIKRPVQAIFNQNNLTNKSVSIATATSSNLANQSQSLQSNKFQKTQFQCQRSIDYASPMSVQPASQPPYNLPPHTPTLQQQKSFSSDTYNAPFSVPAPGKSSTSFNEANQSSKSQSQLLQTSQQQQQQVRFRSSVQISARSKLMHLKPMSKLALFVQHLPVPHSNHFQHERNQRFIVLYGFGGKKQEILDTLHTITKSLFRLFSRRSSIDLSDLSSSAKKRYTNTITTSNFNLTLSEYDHLTDLATTFLKLNHHDQHSIVHRLTIYILETYKSLSHKNYLPRLQHLQFVFDLMETGMNVFNLLSFCIRLLHVGPLIETHLRNTFLCGGTSPSRPFFEYLSYFYLNLIGVFRLHLLSLVLWKDLAIEVFSCLLKIVKGVERPSKCSSHEKCTFMLLNEMFSNCGYIKARFSNQFDPIAHKIRTEKVFVTAPPIDRLQLSADKFQMKSDEKLTAMITTTDFTIDEIEAYITSKGLYYNFVAHVFVGISNLNKDDMLRVANLSAELSNRNNYFILFWQRASQALYHRNTEHRDRTMFNELLNKINIQNHRSKENFKLFLSILAARHCLILNEFIIMVVKTCVMACPGIMADQSHNFAILEPSAWLACHILQYLFTSSPRPLIYRHTTFDQRMLTASFSSTTLPFNSFLLVLKGLFLLSDPKKDSIAATITSTASSRSKSTTKSDRLFNAYSKDTFQASVTNEESSQSNNELELDQFASSVLQEICEHNWIKERCFNEGDNLLKQNQLLEPALGRRAQSLLHIICYPRSHHLRKQNEQASTKDFIKNILQNLDIWTLRESLLEFKLMIELQIQKDNYYEYFVECLAKTTVDFLIDPDKSSKASAASGGSGGGGSSNGSRSRYVRSKSVNSKDNNNEDATSEKNPNSVQEAGSVGGASSSSGMPMDSVKSPNNLEENMAGVSESAGDFGEAAAGGNCEILNDTSNRYESDSIYNFELDKMDQPECDDLEVLRIHKQNETAGVWLIAPLICKLQDNCQLKVLEHASKTLQDLGKAFWSSKNKTEKENQAMRNLTAWSQQPFFSLLISCLKSKDEQRPLLNSLFNGLTDFVNGKEDKILSEDPRLKQIMLETLHVRLSLVGSMFDFILKNSNDFINWAWLFVQLIFSGVVDPDSHQLAFTMIIDMLFILVHHIITLEPNLENNKHYQTIVKKISKETKDFSDVPNTRAINHIRRLMPLTKNTSIDIFTIDQNFQVASKTLATSLDKRKGYKFAKKERVSTWELVEGVKNASALCTSWFGVAKIERKMLRYEYQQKLLIRHKHLNMHRDLAYFKEKPDVPNDLIDVGQQIILPTPSTPQTQTNASMNNQSGVANGTSTTKKEKSDLLLLNGGGTTTSPGGSQLNQSSHSNADIVILGSTQSTMPVMNLNSPIGHGLAPQHMQQQHHQQIIHSQQQPPHSLIMNRLQQHPQQQPIQQQTNNMQAMHHQQQMQHLVKQPHQSHQLQHQQSMPQGSAPVGKNSSSINRSNSTPDKKNSGSAKKRNTTPRRGAAAVRGANAVNPAAASTVPVVVPPNLTPASNTMNPQQLSQQQKLMQQQQQQQQYMQQRSTNSPMLMQQQQQPGQQYPGYQNAGIRQPVPGPLQPPPPPPQQTSIQPQAQSIPAVSHQQINQRIQGNIPQQPAYNTSSMNGTGSVYAVNQPPKSLTPQPVVAPNNQYNQQQRPMMPQQGQQPRPGFSNIQPNANNLSISQPMRSTTPTLTSQLGPAASQGVQAQQQRRPMQPPVIGQGNNSQQAMYAQQQQQQQQQQQRMIQPQLGGPTPVTGGYSTGGINMQQQQLASTSDMSKSGPGVSYIDSSKNSKPQHPIVNPQGITSGPYMQQQQQQQQQRMQYNPQQQQQQPQAQQVGVSNGTNGQMSWQHRQQNMQRQPQQQQPQYQTATGQMQQKYMPSQQQSSQGMGMQPQNILPPGQQQHQQTYQ